GGLIGIFPEGRRNDSPTRLLRLRAGVGALAERTNAPIVPVGIEFPAARQKGSMPRIGRIVVRVGSPIEPPKALENGSPAERARTARDLSIKTEQALALLAGKAPSRANQGSSPPRPRAPAEMPMDSSISCTLVRSHLDCGDALSVIERVYVDEKGWIAS